MMTDPELNQRAEPNKIEYHDDILSTIGHTPLVRINSVTSGLEPLVLAKVEYFNPGGSVKDRIGWPIIEDAERDGRLRPGGTIIEATSGNTGVGLAIAAAIKGYRCVFVMPDKMSQEKILLLRAYGARVVVTPTAVEPEDPRSYYSVARRLVDETPNSILANQYYNPVNPQAHYDTTGPELWAQTSGQITHLVVGMGTGGTISGTGRYLKEQNPDVQIIGVDPIGSILYELHRSGNYTEAEGYKVEGIGEDFLPGTTDLSIVDEIIQVNDRESLLMTRRLVREEGLFGGGSSGSVMAGALKFIRQHRLGPEAIVVVILPDSGSRYLSKVYNDDWMRENGFLDQIWSDIRAGDIQATKESGRVYTARATDLLKEVVAQMKDHNVSQLPVVNGEGRLVGLVSEIDLLNHMLMSNHVHQPDETIEGMINTNVPIVGPNAQLETLMSLIKDRSAVVIVNHEDQVEGILTKIDILDYLSSQIR
ncbi:MAG: cystathionine beta-synthase [Candidatus Promineofilum sp.]|nr:cystathionine beta-synthase [Promineifilum sp.]MBP9657660.1 cystathionine beta-synthase [Promineifilum sp.]